MFIVISNIAQLLYFCVISQMVSFMYIIIYKNISKCLDI